MKLMPDSAAKPTQKAKPSFKKSKLWHIWGGDDLGAMPWPTDAAAANEHKRLKALVWWQSVAVAVLVMILIVAVTVLQPINRYRAVRPDSASMNLVPLFTPNLTNDAVRSWVATSVTALMTIGFGDFDQQILSQRDRFTDDGWDSFTEAIRKNDLRSAFKGRQLVLTTAPSNIPVITAQGEGKDHVYFWKAEMPIIMTYSTNAGKTRRERAIVKLTIVRVPPQESEGGIAIKQWVQD